MIIVPECQKCGACCEFYDEITVFPNDANFHWLKENGYLERFGNRSLRKENGRCVALKGDVGESVNCSIYDHRPQGCKDYERGIDRCRNAVFVVITRKGKSLFTDDPESWPAKAPMQINEDVLREILNL